VPVGETAKLNNKISVVEDFALIPNAAADGFADFVPGLAVESVHLVIQSEIVA